MVLAFAFFILVSLLSFFFFFFNDTATTEIYTLSLHDALPISARRGQLAQPPRDPLRRPLQRRRSEEHTSELQSHSDLVCRLLLEKKKTNTTNPPSSPTTTINLHKSLCTQYH